MRTRPFVPFGRSGRNLILASGLAILAIHGLPAQSTGGSLPDPIDSTVRDATRVYTPELGRSLTAPGTDSTDVSAPNRVNSDFDRKLRVTPVLPQNFLVRKPSDTDSIPPRMGAAWKSEAHFGGKTCSQDSAGQLTSALRGVRSKQQAKSLVSASCGTKTLAGVSETNVRSSMFRGIQRQPKQAAAARRLSRSSATMNAASSTSASGTLAGLSPTSSEIAAAKTLLGGVVGTFGRGGSSGMSRSGRAGWSSDTGTSPAWRSWQGWQGWGEIPAQSGGASSRAGGPSATGLSEKERVGIPKPPTPAQQSGLAPSGGSSEAPEE